MINTNTLIETIKKKLGSFYSTDAHSSVDLLRYVNSAIRYISIRKNFNFNKYSYELTTDESNTEYDIPYQIETFYVLNESWELLDLYTFEEYFSETDKDNKICIFEDKLITTFKWNLTVYYRWYISTLTSSTETLDIPEHFFDVLVLIWSYYWYMDVSAFDKANRTKNISDWFLKDMATRDSDKFPLNLKRMNKSNHKVW